MRSRRAGSPGPDAGTAAPPPGRWPAAAVVLGLLAGAEALHQVREHADRWDAWEAGRLAADRVGKPLLNVGCPRRYPFKYPCGDVCLDVSAWRLAACRSPVPVPGDVRDMRCFPDKAFGAAVCAHVLEHLPTPADAWRALAELRRVADHVFVCSPHRTSLGAWLQPDHRLWVDHDDRGGVVAIEQRDRSGAAPAFGLRVG